MALPSWPAIAYAPERSSLQRSSNPGEVLRTDMNSGTTRQRRQYTARITVQPAVIEMSNADAATFETFFAYTLGDGAARFTMPVWNGTAFVTKNVTIKADSKQVSEIGVTHKKVAFTLLVENLY